VRLVSKANESSRERRKIQRDEFEVCFYLICIADVAQLGERLHHRHCISLFPILNSGV